MAIRQKTHTSVLFSQQTHYSWSKTKSVPDCRSPYSPSTSSSETSSLSCSPASLLVHGRDTAATLKSNVRLRETLRAPQCHLERSRMDPNPTHSTKNISCRPSFSQITPFSLLVLVCFAFLCLPQNAGKTHICTTNCPLLENFLKFESVLLKLGSSRFPRFLPDRWAIIAIFMQMIS